MEKRSFLSVVIKMLVFEICVLAIIAGINVGVDASSVIRPQHTELAKLSLNGYAVSRSGDYNERVFQVCMIKNMKKIPGTIVLGSSRGWYLGKDVTGYEDIYNNCVAGACLEDYYAIIGLYGSRFHRIPKRVIIEVSPWVFYRDNPEGRWLEFGEYSESAHSLYKKLNGVDIPVSESTAYENPYISFPYFRYNLEQLTESGFRLKKEENLRIDPDGTEVVEYPDGTIRYDEAREYENDERLRQVLEKSGPCSYENSHLMTEVDPDKAAVFEKLVDYLQSKGAEVVFYLQPFSVTQCRYSFDEDQNPGYRLAEDYIRDLAAGRGISVLGGYDARRFEGITDERFVDYMHLDKIGTGIVWNSGVLK